jgi:hypothetical protein
MELPIRQRSPRRAPRASSIPLEYAASGFMLVSCMIWCTLWITLVIVGWRGSGLSNHRFFLLLAGGGMVFVGAVGIAFAIHQLRLRRKFKSTRVSDNNASF